jgi:hypothetical protein
MSDDTKPKVFRHWDPPGKGRKLVVHLYDTEIPLCQRLIDRVGLTDEQLEKLAAFMQECIVAEGPKSENRFMQAGGKVAGVMIMEFPFRILGSLPVGESVPMWVDAEEQPKKKKSTTRRKKKAK